MMGFIFYSKFHSTIRQQIKTFLSHTYFVTQHKNKTNKDFLKLQSRTIYKSLTSFNIMDFSDLRRLKTTNTLATSYQDQVFQDFSKRRSQGANSETSVKNVLIIYISGSMGANKDLEIERGGLQKIMSMNFYLCDLEHTKRWEPKLEYLITPNQETGIRIRYKVVQLQDMDTSVNMKIEYIGRAAQIIYQNYQHYNSFIVVTGLDTICHVGTTLSFMLENLSKLVICTGGYLPLSRMRNDSVSNLVECFSVIAEASTINDVLIVCKNKGFRANRCIKMTQGDFQNISSPNLPALCSIKTKLRVRSYLFHPQPSDQFRIFTEVSRKVKIIRLNQYECLQSLQYDLKNPFIKGIVIQSYSFANIPNLPQILNLFKQAFQDPNRRIILINISQAICSKNQSLMRQYLQNYHIYYGSDMTCEAALAKLAYLIGKGYTEEHIIKLMQTNLRGELTEEKEKLQFKINQVGLMQIVDEVLCEYFPTGLKDLFYFKIENNISRYIINNCSPQQFKQLFYSTLLDEKQNRHKVAQLTDIHHILHRAVASGNGQMTQFLIEAGADINLADHQSRSPLFHAVRSRNKPIIQLLSKNGARVIAYKEDLFEVLVQALKKDDIEFFNLLYHIEFKRTMAEIKNEEMRTVAHIAGLLRAEKCYQFIKEKFNVSVNQGDCYGVSAAHYMEGIKQ